MTSATRRTTLIVSGAAVLVGLGIGARVWASSDDSAPLVGEPTPSVLAAPRDALPSTELDRAARAEDALTAGEAHAFRDGEVVTDDVRFLGQRGKDRLFLTASRRGPDFVCLIVVRASSPTSADGDGRCGPVTNVETGLFTVTLATGLGGAEVPAYTYGLIPSTFTATAMDGASGPVRMLSPHSYVAPRPGDRHGFTTTFVETASGRQVSVRADVG